MLHLKKNDLIAIQRKRISKFTKCKQSCLILQDKQILLFTVTSREIRHQYPLLLYLLTGHNLQYTHSRAPAKVNATIVIYSKLSRDLPSDVWGVSVSVKIGVFWLASSPTLTVVCQCLFYRSHYRHKLIQSYGCLLIS